MSSYTKNNAWKQAHDEDMKDPEYAAEFEKTKRELDFAIALANARQARSMTQAALSKATGIKQPMIARYEKGQMPQLPSLQKIASALNARIVIEPDGGTVVTLVG